VGLAAAPGDVSLPDVTAAVVELAQSNQAQAADIAKLKRERAEAEVDRYIGAGRLLPKSRTTAVELALTNPDGLDAIVAPADKPYVALGRQEGIGGPDGEQRQEQDIDAEVARLTAQHSEFFSPDDAGKGAR
jgi:stage V sporulation protein SpoVS